MVGGKAFVSSGISGSSATRPGRPMTLLGHTDAAVATTHFSAKVREFKKRMSVSKLPWAIIGLMILFQATSYLGNSLNYSLRSQQSSPDGKKTVFEFTSHQDVKDHAPYGSTLSLSLNGSIRNPDAGYVFFAGYCKQPLTYAWQNNEKIIVNCQSSKENRTPRTQAIRMYGIAVELKSE